MIKPSTYVVNYYPLNQINCTIAEDRLYITENNVRHKRFFMINSPQESHLLSQQS